MSGKIICIITTILLLLGIYSCNTLHGLGKDIKSIGEAIEEATD